MKPPASRSPHQISRDARGVVYLEFLMAIMPLLTMFLAITQIALLRVGQMVVQHAANRAARTAVVILEDVPEKYGDAPRGDLTSGQSETGNPVVEFFDDIEAAYASLVQEEDVPGGARLEDIRRAAYHALAVLAPPPSHYSGEEKTLKGAIGDSPWGRVAVGFIAYGGAAAAVTLHTGDSDLAITQVGRHDDVTVRVRFLMPCLVPLVSGMMCVSGHELGLASLGFPTSEKAKHIVEKLALVESPLRRDVNLAFNGRFTLLEAEATLPNQGADYVDGEK